MFYISEGHARQPTQRVSSLTLKISAERAIITERGERAKERYKNLYTKRYFALDFSVIQLSGLRQKWFQGIGSIILKVH